MLKKIPTLIAIATLFLAAPLLAGVVFEVETTYHQSSEGPESNTMYAEGKNLKMTIAAGEGGGKDGDMIYRGDRRELVVVDDESKTYQVLDRQTVEQWQGQMGGRMDEQMAIARKELQKRLGDMNEEQRRALEQALGNPKGGAGGLFGSEPVKPEVRKTGERATKQGYPCVKYEVLRGGQKIREIWITDWKNVEGASEVADIFLDMSKFFGELMDSGFGNQEFNDYDLIFGQGGFPVVVREFEDDSLESESSLRSASRRRLDPADFEPPSGYKRRTMPGF